MAKKTKVVRLSHSTSPFREGQRLLILPVQAGPQPWACRAVVTSLESSGAWLELLEQSAGFPTQEEVFLVNLESRRVWTHRSRILRRQEGRCWVDQPSLSVQERSPLAAFTGRQDFRVEANLEVMILLTGPEFAKAMPRSGVLCDLSRGGMGLKIPLKDIYLRGQEVEVQVVSWTFPVSVNTRVGRVWVDGEEKRMALGFPKDLRMEQQELIASLVIHTQRQHALGSSLPVPVDEP